MQTSSRKIEILGTNSPYCPVCGSSVKAENLERHVKKVHPREKMDIALRTSALDPRTLERFSGGQYT